MSIRRSSSVLVGRKAELRAIEEAVAGRAERPLVILGGEAGIGKSRLVREVAARAARTGATVVVGSCVELGADLLPYAPFVEALGRLVEDLGDRAEEILGATRPELAVLLPGLEPGPEEGPGAGSRGRMYEAVRGLLDRAPEPLVLVLEDIHWADRSTLELLSYLARRLRRGRTLILATYRTDELHRRHPLLPVLAELQRGGRALRIELGQLDPVEIARLVREIRGEAGRTQLVEAIVGRSQGNPFLIEELVAADAGPGTPLPATLKDLLLARVGTIDAPTRRMLAIAAAVGRPVDVELLEAAWEGSSADLELALRDAIDRALLVVEPTRRTVAFRHALLAEAIDDDLLPGERVRLHATLARILAERPELASPTSAGAAAELAHHLLAARDLPAAFGAAVCAADAAARARAWPEAAGLYERALELFEQVPDLRVRPAVDHVVLLDRAAEASFHSGEATRAVSLGSLAVSESESGPDAARTGVLLVRLIEWTEELGHYAKLEGFAERAVELVPDGGAPTPERAFVLLGLAAARMHAGQNREGAHAARESARVAAACGATGYEAIARSVMAITLMGLGRDAEATVEIESAVALAEASGGTEEIVLAHANRLSVYSYTGRFESAAEALEMARVTIEREGALTHSEPFYAVIEAEILASRGRWAEAEELASACIDGAPSLLALGLVLCLRGIIRIRRGRVDVGEDDLRAALAAEPSTGPEIAAEAFAGLAEAAIGRADPAAALTLVDDGLRVLEPTDDLPWRAHLSALGLRAAADLAERSRARRDREPAAAASAATGAHLEHLRAGLDGRLVEEGGVDDLMRAKAAWGFAEASRSAGEPSPDLWDAAASALPGVGQTYLAYYSRFREAEAAMGATADRSRATAALRDAREWAVLVGADPLVAQIDALTRRARLDLTNADPAPQAPVPGGNAARAPSDPYRLSPREREVLALVADGRTNREIGATLFISEKTASVHVTHILGKLGVPSRGAAAALAARGGLLEPPRT